MTEAKVEQILEAPVVAEPGANRLLTILKARELGIALLIVVVILATTLKNHDFFSADTFQVILTSSALFALLAAGETMVLITRNVDLSVGSTLGLSAYVVGTLLKHHSVPVWSGYLVGIAVGLLVGAVNGFITTFLRVPSLVVTLAMLYVIRGIDGKIVNGNRIDNTDVPHSFTLVGYKTLFGVPWLAIVVAVVVVVATYAMRSFRSCRELYAIGSNPDAAELAGIPSSRRVFLAFLTSGALAGLAGALFLALYTQVDVSAGKTYELSVIAACVVGGVAIFGGSGSVLGAALGAILLNTIDQALTAARISSHWNQAIAGALLLLAIAADRWLSLRVTRSLQTAEGAHRDL